MKKIIALLLCVTMISACFYGCSGGDKSVDFIYPFSGKINSFDPQVASTSDEFLIVENCYEGLVRVLDDGTVQNGVAENWSISDDGKTYTFNLKKGVKWNVQSDDPENLTKAQELMGADFNPDVTANDFVFALQRAVSKETECPLYSSVSNIVNAPQIHSGRMSASKLGVKAIDDYTLEIRLSSADDGFMNTLSTAVAMPCNEEYFYATKGRYGLGLEYTIFNGQFYVSNILEASYILKNNDLYTGSHPSAVTDVTLNITDSTEDIAKNLKSGYYDAAYISGKEYEELNSDDITATPYENKMWALVLNKNKQIFSNSDLRKALCLSISSPNVEGHSYLQSASCFTPASCTITGKSAPEVLGKTVVSQDTEEAKALWRKGLEDTGYTVADITLVVNKDMEDTAKEIVQGIQSGIGSVSSYGDGEAVSFSLKIKALNQEDYNTAVSNGDYDLLLYQFTAGSQNCISYLQSIINSNIAGELKAAEKALDKAQSSNASNLAQACANVEKTIMKDYSIMPVMFESSYYAQAKGVSGVNFHAGSGRVSFVNATREK